MTRSNLEKLCTDLQAIARIIPLGWGNIQNDVTDGKLQIFGIENNVELEDKLKEFNEQDKQYFRRRWFLYKCATCDEHIFCLNQNVTRNPLPKDKAYDIEFNGNAYLRFDLKGTVIPKDFRNKINYVLANPQKLVDFYYQKQSSGVRIGNQNRLFIIHHSFKDQNREMYLRCIWKQKKEFYQEITKLITPERNFLMFKGKLALLLFIFEYSNGRIVYKLI